MEKFILVAGGAGFIGSHLCRTLVEKGENVICVDNLSTGNQENIAGLISSSRFCFLETDITKPLWSDESIKEIYNLACPASPIGYNKLPLETLAVNSSGVWNLLDIAREKEAKFLQTSTSEVYGDPKEHPQKESYWGHVNPIGPRSCYDEGKRFAESLIINYKKKYGLETKIVRIFNTYGPQMDLADGRVVVNLLRQALTGADLTVYGDGTQTRSFCYVSDMVDGLMRMMASSESGPINLGNPGEFTIKELADLIIKLTDSKSKIVFPPLPTDDPTRRRPDISLAVEKLGWEPKISLEEGLRLSLPWFLTKLNLPK